MSEEKPNYKEYVQAQSYIGDPSWKQHGYKSKEDAIASAFQMLMSDSESIMKNGVGNDLTIQYGDYIVTLRGKKK